MRLLATRIVRRSDNPLSRPDLTTYWLRRENLELPARDGSKPSANL